MGEPELDWSRLIGELVALKRHLRRKATQAARETGIGEGVWRRWFRGERATPRGDNIDAVLAFAETVWPDYRERFAISRDAAPPDTNLPDDPDDPEDEADEGEGTG